MTKNQTNEIDLYIGTFPMEVQKVLQQLRALIKKNAPEADEVISYKMPAYQYHGMLVYFAGYPHHIGFYPTPSGIEAFKKEISHYTYAKGSVQFPIDQPLPVGLIAKMIKFRVKENSEKAKSKSEKKKKISPY